MGVLDDSSLSQDGMTTEDKWECPIRYRSRELTKMSSPLSFDFDRPFGPSQRKGEFNDSTRHRTLETAASLDLKVLEDPYTLNLW